MELQDYAVVGAAIAAPAALALILGALARAQAAQNNVLLLTVSGPGTIDLPTGTHSYPGPTEVTVNAVPAAGYQTVWNLNGVDVELGVNTYSVYVAGVVTLGVYFSPVGPPVGTIAGIRAVGSVGLLQNWEFFASNAGAVIDIQGCDASWNPSNFLPDWEQLMTFKVYDQGDHGVPNIPVAIYPELNPDDTPYAGLIEMNEGVYTPSDQLTLTTDADGLITFRIVNLYLADGITGKELSNGSGLYATKFCLLAGDVRVFPVYKGLAPGVSCLWTGSGGGGTITYSKRIDAQIVGTAFRTVQDITVSYGVRWRP